jgi:hypothetical protein
VTYTEKVITGEAPPITHLQKVIAGVESPVTHLEYIWAGGSPTPTEHEYTGVVPYTFTANGSPLISWRISGNTVQSTTPTPDNPIMPEGTGERTGNLFDGVIYEGFYNDNGQLVIDTSNGCHTNLIKANTQITYTVSNLWTTSFNFAVYEWDINKQWLRRTNRQLPPSDKITFTLNNDCAYFSLQINSNYDYTKLMLNIGSTALPYEPFGFKIPISSANTTTPVYLGEVETTRKVKKYEFTGTENISSNTLGVSDVGFTIAISNMLPNGRKKGYCTHFVAQNSPSGSSLDGITYGASDKTLYVTFSVATATAYNLTDVASVKTWLAQQYAAGTPVTVWYVLATPQTAVVNEPLQKIGDYADEVSNVATIPTVNGSTTIDVDTTVKPSEVYIKYKGV